MSKKDLDFSKSKEEKEDKSKKEDIPIEPLSPIPVSEIPARAFESTIVSSTNPINVTNEPGTIKDNELIEINNQDNVIMIPPGISRQAKPTGADSPIVNTSEPVFKTKPPEDYQPSNRYKLQTYNRDKEQTDKEQTDKEQTDNEKHWLDDFITNNKRLKGIHSRSQFGSRIGDPLEVIGEEHLGDTVHNVFPGGTRLEVQTPNKRASIPITIPRSNWTNPTEPDKKRKISLLFPSINPDVHQQELSIIIEPYTQLNNEINNEEPWEPAVQVFPKSVSSKDILVPLNCRVHIELVHISSEGFRSTPYILDFILNSIDGSIDRTINPQPLRASPIGFQILESVYCMK